MRGLISIVIINWDGRVWLEKCLSSVFDQSYTNYEVIVVDNDSKDDSIKFIRKKYPATVIIENSKNVGFARANNVGIEKAHGEYILLLNNDTYLDKNFLVNIVKEFNGSGCDVLGPREADYYTKKPKEVYRTLIDPLGHPVWVCSNNSIEQCSYLTGVCLFFRKALYFDTKGFDENFFMYCEEVDWFWRLGLLGKRFRYSENLNVYHAIAGSTGVGLKYNSFLWRNCNTLQMLLKNYSWPNLIWVLPLYVLQNFVEILAFAIMLKPRISLSYLQGWWFSIIHITAIMKQRKWVQKHRIVSDVKIVANMYPGPGKIAHLMSFVKVLSSAEKGRG